MKKSGFTLIELLAVIVILAIIALIAVPIVLQIIEDSKKSSQKESINMYAKAIENGVANYFLKNPKKKEIPEIEELKAGGYINYTGNIDCKVKIYPNGKIYLEKCTVDGELVEYTYGEKIKTLCTLDGEKTGEEEINRGDKYKCEVIKGMAEPYTFYVLGKEGNKVNLIMDRNICEDGTIDYDNDTDNNYCRYAWYDDGDNPVNYDNDKNEFGPVTAMTVLGNATRNWNNVPNMNLTYNDIQDQTSVGYTESTEYGYTAITIKNGVGYITKKDGTTQTPITLTDNKPLKARLAKFSEIYKDQDDNYCNYNLASCPTYLVDNLSYDLNYANTCSDCVNKYSHNQNNGITHIYGYWLLPSYLAYINSVRSVHYYGYLHGSKASNNNHYGVRAVITVSKYDLS